MPCMVRTEGVASEEGLAAYAMDTVPEDLLQQATASGSSDASASQHLKLDVAAADPAVIEMLQGMEKLVSSRHLPRLQEWLKIFVKVKACLITCRKLLLHCHVPDLQSCRIPCMQSGFLCLNYDSV